VDADHFKHINDEHGHQIGDQALKIIATTIRDALTGAEIVGRIGGEEFAVFLPNVDRERAFEIADGIRRKIGNIIFPEDNAERILSVSIGGVSFSNPASYKELFKVADRRLYEAKASGRNLVKI
jgi:diguanylate cyclase